MDLEASISDLPNCPPMRDLFLGQVILTSFVVELQIDQLFSSIILVSYENWLRLVILIDSAGKRLCYDILHEKEQLPLDGGQLYFKLESYKTKMHYQIHKEILCPPSKIIDENKFDLVIYTAVIHLMFGAKYDTLIYDVRDMRHKIFHMKDVWNCTANIEQLWNEACTVLCKHGFDVKSLNVLRTSDLSLVKECKGILEFQLF